MKRALTIFQNHGGLSTDLKQGTEYSFGYSRCIDFRKRPTGLSILPKTVKETGSTVTGLITQMIQLPSGKIVAIDHSGGVYTRTTGGTWAKNGTTLPDTAMGMSYDLQTDQIIVPGLNNVHVITNADGRFTGGSFTVNANYITANTDQSASNSANTYTTTGSITETSANMLSFTPTVTPLIRIDIWVTTKGTGDLVVTLHDAANNVLGTVTLANASITNGALNTFTFSSPILTTIAPNGLTYHVHVTHTGGTASTIGTATAADLSTARYATYVNRLLNTTNQMHPTIDFLQYVLIGNGRYVAAWEVIDAGTPTNLQFVRHRLVFPTGFEVTSMALYTEYVAIAAEKRSSSATNEFQEGRIFFWDGTSSTYNFSIAIPEGAPYSIYSHKNILYWFAGGSLWSWSGGNPSKVFQMPNTDTEYSDTNFYMVNYPNMMAVRNGILMTGFPSETNSTSIEHGVYSFGARNRNYRESFGFSYITSNGTYSNGTNLRIGTVQSYGQKMFVSWRDNTNYGVDIIDANSDPFANATWESLIFDGDRSDKTKQAVKLVIEYEPLPTGATVTPKYKIDRGAWVTGTAGTAGSSEIILNINKRFKEIQLGMDLTATTATPVIISVTLIFEDLGYERD